MSKICPKCNKEWSDDFTVCPIDGTVLISKSQQSAGFSLNLGDANAISGGVNMSDNHSVSNNTVNTNTSNVDSHNVITNNITQVEREKTSEELKHEKEFAFREECIKVYGNGIMTSENKRKLDDLQYRLGLDENTANRILSEVAKRSERKSSSLSPVHRITYNNIKTAINANRLDLVNRLMAQMKAMVQRYSVEEIQFTYYMLQAVLHPKECIEEYERHHEDKYWQTFWSSIAYRRTGNIEKSELLVADVGDKWTDTIPQENVFILASVNALIDRDFDTAKSLYDNIGGEHSPYLSNLTTCIYTLLYGDMLSYDKLKQWQKDGLFYTSNLFAEINTCNSEQKRLQEKVETKRLVEEKKLKAGAKPETKQTTEVIVSPEIKKDNKETEEFQAKPREDSEISVNLKNDIAKQKQQNRDNKSKAKIIGLWALNANPYDKSGNIYGNDSSFIIHCHIQVKNMKGKIVKAILTMSINGKKITKIESLVPKYDLCTWQDLRFPIYANDIIKLIVKGQYRFLAQVDIYDNQNVCMASSSIYINVKYSTGLFTGPKIVIV